MSSKRLVIDKDGKRVLNRLSIHELLSKTPMVRLCGVHNAMSARLAEEAGFEGCWLSSFEAHASCRLPDADILSIPDYADMCNKISDRTSIPVVVDGDAGGGSPINTIRMVREYGKNGASGICIEDNQYPKRCSFYEGVSRTLAHPKSHAAKIRAACDNRISDDFYVVARTEALIVGLSVSEAVDRVGVYRDAGADAILVHHKGKDPDSMFEVIDKLDYSIPLVAVPTTYNEVTESDLAAHGIKIVIYANYGIRSAVKAMKSTFAIIAENHYLGAANTEVVDMSEIFRLIGVEDLEANEKKYSV